MPTENKTAFVLANNEASCQLNIMELFALLTEEEKNKVIAFAETLKEKRQIL